MDAAKDHERAAGTGEFADRVAAQGVAGVNADADNVSRLDRGRIERFEGFVAKNGIAELWGSGGSQDKQPTGSDDGGSKCSIARIDEMNAQ